MGKAEWAGNQEPPDNLYGGSHHIKIAIVATDNP
jgi:hypothetical protein